MNTLCEPTISRGRVAPFQTDPRAQNAPPLPDSNLKIVNIAILAALCQRPLTGQEAVDWLQNALTCSQLFDFQELPSAGYRKRGKTGRWTFTSGRCVHKIHHTTYSALFQRWLFSLSLSFSLSLTHTWEEEENNEPTLYFRLWNQMTDAVLFLGVVAMRGPLHAHNLFARDYLSKSVTYDKITFVPSGCSWPSVVTAAKWWSKHEARLTRVS